MASGFIGNEVPRKGLRVRSPCPPLCDFVTNMRICRQNSTRVSRRLCGVGLSVWHEATSLGI